MKKLTKNERIALLDESNKLLAKIPNYQLAIPVSVVEYDDILFTDKGYIMRLYLEYGEISDIFLGKTRKEAVKGLAHQWIETYASYFIAHKNYLYLHPLDIDAASVYNEIDQFKAHCNSSIDKAEK